MIKPINEGISQPQEGVDEYYAAVNERNRQIWPTFAEQMGFL
jgi:hypothetical protein